MLYQLSYFRNFGSPWGNRTPLARMKILSTNRYTNGPSYLYCLGNTCSNLAVWTGLEPATPCVTGRYSNQLNYHTNLKELTSFLKASAKIGALFETSKYFHENLSKKVPSMENTFRKCL